MNSELGGQYLQHPGQVHLHVLKSSPYADKTGYIEEGESGFLEPQADADDRALQHSV